MMTDTKDRILIVEQKPNKSEGQIINNKYKIKNGKMFEAVQVKEHNIFVKRKHLATQGNESTLP